MKLNAVEIKRRYGLANSVKTTWDTEYREIFEYCMPARDGYDKAQGGQKIRENLYSSVGEQSANEFVNTLQEVLAPPMTPWISLISGMRIKEEDKETINKELEKIADTANQYKDNSSFDMAFSEFLYDLFAGTACLLVLPGRPRRPISFKAIPLREYCIEEGVDGEVRGVYRKFSLKRELLNAQWIELKNYVVTKAVEDKDITLIESTWFDYDLSIYHYQVIDEAESIELVHREYRTNPFIVLRWNKCAGEYYGRGVGMTAINDIKTLNLIKYYSLRNFAYQLPILLAQEDEMLDVDSFDPTPLTLNVVPDTTSSIMPLDISAKYDQESYKTEELTMDIKKNTYSSTLPSDAGKGMTATEIRERIAELRKSLNSVAGRLVNECMNPLTLRIIDVLGDTGFLGDEYKKKFDVLNIDGMKYKNNIITPIGKIIRYAEAQAMKSNMAMLVELDPTGQSLEEYVKTEDAVPAVLELGGMPLKYIRDSKEVQAKRQQVAQNQQAMQQQAVEQDVMAENAKATGKAEAEQINN